jgi:cystathionine beta-lyase/cystathionine gamma-synthase
MGFATDAIHVGNDPDPLTGAVAVPIYQTSTYVQEALGKHRGFEYSRTQNPTRFALERNVAALEKGKHGFAFGSGMAAISALMHLFEAGSHVVATRDMYGGTHRLFNEVLRSYGLEFTYVDTSDLGAAEAAFRENTRLLYIETPTNPTLIVSDIAAAALLAKSRGAVLAVDNTFMTPYFQRPLELGADVVVHSTTKYLNGHSDVVGGVLAVSDESLAERLRFIQNAVGAVPGPFDCWLVLRGTKTLALRMEKHNANAGDVARHLRKDDRIERVFYPGLPDHPGHKLCASQCSGFGGMVSFETGSLERARAVLNNVKVFSLAGSLGGVESLIAHPATMTHSSVPKEIRDRGGITDGLVRLSVGIEDVEDLISGLDQALARM